MNKNILTFKDHYNGMSVAEMLLKEDYVVMLSYEEDLLILNYEWSENGADRNDVVFMRRDEYEEEQSQHYEDIIEDIRSEIRQGYIQSLDEI